MDKERGDRILQLLDAVEVRERDGDERGDLPAFFWMLAQEYAEAGRLTEARTFLDKAQPGARTVEQRRACRDLRRRIERGS